MIDERQRGALLDLAAWSGVAVREDEPEAALQARVASLTDAPLGELSTRGLRLLAEIRGIAIPYDASRRELLHVLRRARGWRGAWRAHRRRVLGALLSRAVAPRVPGGNDDSTMPTPERLRKNVQRLGLVAGLAGELRGAADDFVAEKLADIERRVDAKLDQIDARLQQWREREMAARLRMLKLTLIASILVALISLGYDYLRPAVAGGRSFPTDVEMSRN